MATMDAVMWPSISSKPWCSTMLSTSWLRVAPKSYRSTPYPAQIIVSVSDTEKFQIPTKMPAKIGKTAGTMGPFIRVLTVEDIYEDGYAKWTQVITVHLDASYRVLVTFNDQSSYCLDEWNLEYIRARVWILEMKV
uniref:Uncharacterized protein n=1 Tax=Oryza punctata TaxID=4537 RepID=A0A0E0M5D2_ORYPU